MMSSTPVSPHESYLVKIIRIPSQPKQKSLRIQIVGLVIDAFYNIDNANDSFIWFPYKQKYSLLGKLATTVTLN